MKKILIVSLLVLSATLTACSSSDDTSEETGITLSEIEQHSEVEDCWMAIDGKVYEVTEYIPLHPEQPQISAACGKEATSEFDGIRNSKGHSVKAEDMMKDYYIGDFSN